MDTRCRAIASVVVVAAAAACSQGAGKPAGALGGRTFLSESVTEDGRHRNLVPGTRISLSFEGGRVGATAGCNSMSGPVAVQRDRLVVGDLATTDIGCRPELHDQDSWLAGVLGADPAYVLDGNRLRLVAKGTAIDLLDRVVADPDRPLNGTVWRLDGIVDGDAVSSVPGQVRATARFVDGQVAIDVEDCNTGGASVDIGPAELVVGPLRMTTRACAAPQATVEAALVAVLRGRVAYRIEAALLTLDGAAGKGLVLRADRSGRTTPAVGPFGSGAHVAAAASSRHDVPASARAGTRRGRDPARRLRSARSGSRAVAFAPAIHDGDADVRAARHDVTAPIRASGTARGGGAA